MHDLLCEVHLALEVRVVRSETVATGSLGQEERVALLHLELGHHFLVEDESGGCADGCDFEPGHVSLPSRTI